MKRFAVIGNPISHSKSPVIHMQFARQFDIDIDYQALLFDESNFADQLRDFFFNEGKGCNVTVPFKLDAYSACDSLSDRAKCAEAVNTVFKKEDGTLFGDNTDGIGLVRDLLTNKIELSGSKILLLGAGGAVQGVIKPLLDHGAESITVANRTLAKATTLVNKFEEPRLTASSFEELTAQYDIVINGTSAGLTNSRLALPTSIFSGVKCAYDMVYSQEATSFQRQARGGGANLALDGLGMLVEQAAESFYIWFNLRPNTQIVYDSLR